MTTRKPICIAQEFIPAGKSCCVKLALNMLYTSAPIEIPVYVFHGKKDGPILFITAALHGDEINGVEIIRRLHHNQLLKHLRGTLITIPVVNVYGLMLHSRYLPDRRDLNRQFPGSEKGSMASRLANLIMKEIVARSTHGIDLHTGSIHRINYPHIRYSNKIIQSIEMAKAFATSVIIPSNVRDGSLRYATDTLNIPMIIYEAGGALRFDEESIRQGVKGIIKVMTFLEMLAPSQAKLHLSKKEHQVAIAKSASWVRALASGMIIESKALGTYVARGEVLCLIVDPLGNTEIEIKSPCKGLIIGKTEIPLVNEGDALFNIALF